MPGKEFVGYQCWDESRISEVINKEAVSVDKSVFLATHSPINRIAFLKSPSRMLESSEQKILDELLSRGQNDQHSFLVVHGIPGTGKSHLIRWLKDRYKAETPTSEEVFLIERAQNTLLGTLQQIVQQSESIFSDVQPEQLTRMSNAVSTLSSEAIADSIIDNLRIATSEIEKDPQNKVNSRITKNIGDFLLDKYVRQELKREGGPIDRITQFLSSEDKVHADEVEEHEFHADDFDFPSSVLRDIRDKGGYKEARDLAEALNLKSAIREQLASYLNDLLGFAIGKTSSLSSDELKQFFFDLRRELKRQGKTLALFIEDITVFQGIDLGLVDVLATQHVGESNTEFCRLTSLIGITDDFFQSRFPDNIKERVTHILTLNKEGSNESELLDNEKSVASFSGKYLNAMRVSQDAMDKWFSKNARIRDLPNRCDDCKFKEECHDAFGFVEYGSNHNVKIGLYPFNEEALWKMYQGIDPSKATRTPRSLLESVLLDVLKSHGEKILEGKFPPKPSEIGLNIEPPSYVKPTQVQTIHSRGKEHAEQLESLVLFWGDRTIDPIKSSGEITVGGLSEGVFNAFGLPFILGDETPIEEKEDDEEDLGKDPGKSGKEKKITSALTKDILSWKGGKKLKNYEKLTAMLVGFFETAVDWETYEITSFDLGTRLRNRRFEIEGQSGRSKGDFHTFNRSTELYFTLQAMADLNDSEVTLERQAVASHMYNLTRWLLDQTEDVVNFVRLPSSNSEPSIQLDEIILTNCFFISLLLGDFNPKDSDTQTILEQILKRAAKFENDPNFNDWEVTLDLIRESHNSKWLSLIERVGKDRTKLCFINLQLLFNITQGSGGDTNFFNAFKAIEIIDRLLMGNWELKPPGNINPNAEELWTDGLWVYDSFRDNLMPVLSAEMEWLSEIIFDNSTYHSSEIIQETNESINKVHALLKDSKRPISFKSEPPHSVVEINKAVDSISEILEVKDTVKFGLSVSGLNAQVLVLREYLEYLGLVRSEFEKNLESYRKRLDELKKDEKEYTKMDKLIGMFISIKDQLGHIAKYSKDGKSSK